MSDDPAAAVGANRRQRVNGTLEAVEDVHAAVKVNLERLVVVVAADFLARPDGRNQRGRN